ncbi:hypothetical protein [Streptomyces vinaceus]|uniref:hypothetical protein n=1 Tax=Streptomyces vinaceus TaxID=1960 RepID=UPI00368519D8
MSKSKPWKLAYVTPGGIYEETHRSRPALYRAADAERARVAEGLSRVTGMTAYRWEPDGNRWVRYERLPITGGPR